MIILLWSLVLPSGTVRFSPSYVWKGEDKRLLWRLQREMMVFSWWQVLSYCGQYYIKPLPGCSGDTRRPAIRKRKLSPGGKMDTSISSGLRKARLEWYRLIWHLKFRKWFSVDISSLRQLCKSAKYITACVSHLQLLAVHDYIIDQLHWHIWLGQWCCCTTCTVCGIFCLGWCSLFFHYNVRVSWLQHS